MKKHIFKALFFILLFWQSLTVVAQDIQFSMFYAVPLYLSPAFAGSRHANRAMVHQRWQWYNQPGRFTTFYAAFDTYSVKYKSGVGGYIVNDIQGVNKINSLLVMLQYAYELRISQKSTMRFGLEGGLRQAGVSVGTLPSDYSNEGQISSSSFSDQTMKPDIGAGLLYYNKKLWASFSAQHLNRPNMEFQGVRDPYPIKYSVTAGYKIPLLIGDPKDANLWYLTPTSTFKQQRTNTQFDLGLYVTRKWFIAGVWYRGLPLVKQYDPKYPNNESVVFLLGTSYLGFGFGYSYDLTISTQGVNTGGAHEFNLSYAFRTKGKKGPLRSLPCPDFEYDILQKRLFIRK